LPDLDDWLKGLGLGKYAATFAKQEIDFDLLPLLTEADIRELGLPVGPRRKLLDAIAALRGGTQSRPGPRDEAERRQLTVMFVDLAQSTRLALRLDPEAMRDVLRDFHQAVAGEIARSGYVAKLMGDGVLAYFGWPQAHEDDARRAVGAALAISDAVAQLASPSGESLACRVGIATGMVVVGDRIGEGAAREHAVVGPTPNLAARLQEIAAPGEIMIAETTRRLLGDGFAVERIGDRLVKGHEAPVPVFRVRRCDTRELPFVGAEPASLAPMVGRDRELAVLRQAWQDVRSGYGRSLLIVGEAGVGKSRLVEALIDEVTNEAVVRLCFRSSPLHSENPFWTIARQLGSTAARFEALAGPVPGRDPGRHRRNLLDAMAAEVLSAVRDCPAMVVFEDAQWADRASLELLAQLSTAQVPLLLIVNSRPEGEPRLAAQPFAVRIALRRLEGAAASALLASAAAPHSLPTRIRKQILTRSDGVPLFIEEMTKAVLEAGSAGEPLSVPATLRDSLIARLDVSPTIKGVAQIASCIGREFAESLLLQVADIPQPELRQGLSALVDADLVIAASPGQFRFKHALLCEIAYETLLTPRRQALHRCIAEALESVPGRVGESEPETLAHHWFAAGLNNRAEPYWLRARHRAAHWEEHLDALADYLASDADKVIPFPLRPERDD
jgi:class 3 adenylate cyclase/DNA-binding transcriptional ArsR family regulator